MVTFIPPSVFVCDSDPAARRGLARLLRAGGYEVVACGDASEFLAAARESTEGCVVLDAQMAGHGGARLMNDIGSASIPMPVVVVTAAEDPRSRRQARDMGAVAFFRKPVDGAALLDAIAWALGTQESRAGAASADGKDAGYEEP